jgi:cell division transport system permease protein
VSENEARDPARFGKQAPILPRESMTGRSLLAVIAIMSFLAALTVGSVRVAKISTVEWRGDLSNEMTIQVKPADGRDLEADLQKALTAAQKSPGVSDARAYPKEESEKLLEPWLGTGLDLSDLPIPRLVVVKLADPNAVDLAGLTSRLAAQVKGAALDDHRVWAKRLQSMANATVLAGLAILSLVFIATVLSVVFATRGAMASNAVVVSVLHICGAEDGFIAREFQRHFLLLGLRGGLAGAVVAGIIFAILGFIVVPSLSGPDTDQVSALFGHFAVGPVGYFGALGIAFLIAVMTALTSRLTVYQHLADGD